MFPSIELYLLNKLYMMQRPAAVQKPIETYQVLLNEWKLRSGGMKQSSPQVALQNQKQCCVLWSA